jgi:hypothetical protein
MHREKKKNSENNLLIYKPMYPGYMDPAKHPKNYCIPCCFQSPRAAIDANGNIWERIRGQDWRGKETKKKKKPKWIFYWKNRATEEKSIDPPAVELGGMMYKANPTPTYEMKDGKILTDTIKGEKQQRPLVSNGKRSKTFGQCDDKKTGQLDIKKGAQTDEAPITTFPLKQNQLGYLPISLQKFLGINNDACKISKTLDHRLKKKKECILRKGIQNNKKGQKATNSFLQAICDIYWFVLDDKREVEIKLSKEKILPVKELLQLIKKRITLDTFVALQNGTLVELFHKEKTINVKKYTTTLLYKASESNEKNMKYFKKVVSSYENFMAYLSDPQSEIGYEYLWDFFTMSSNMNSSDCCGLFPEGLNLIILKEPDDDVIDKIELICPTNHYSDNLFDDAKPTLILYNKYEYFEPLYRVTKQDNSKYTIKKLFFFEQLDRDVPGLKSVLNIIKNKINTSCKPLPSLPRVYTYKQNISFKKLLQIIKQDYSIKRIVLNFNSRIIGVIALKKGGKQSIYIPSAPSALLLDDTTKAIFSHEVLGIDCKSTLHYLNDLKNIGLKTKPIQLIVNDEMIVGVVTETNQFIPIQPEAYISSPCTMKGNKYKLKIVNTSSNNYLKLDADMLTNTDVDTTRIETVKKIKLESNFFNMFRNYLRIILLNFENKAIKRDLLDIINTISITYLDKIKKIILILHHLLDPFISFSIYKLKSLQDIDNIMTCLNLSKGDCSKRNNCIFSGDSCKIHIPHKNLISNNDNREIYFGRMADELIRYPRIRNFILKPKAFLSLNPINYELNNNEIILLEQLLLEKYFQDIVLRKENPYVKTNRIYELINPDKTETYSDNFTYGKNNKVEELNSCLVTSAAESAFEGSQGSFSGAGKFWRDIGLDGRFNIKEFKIKPECSWDIIKVIYKNYYNKDIDTAALKQTLVTNYEKFFSENSILTKKILQTLQWKNKFFNSDGTLKDFTAIFDEDYYLNFLDLVILIDSYKLPVAIISRLSLPSFNKLKKGLGHARKSILINPENKKNVYIIFGSRWKQTPLLPVYSLISAENISIEVELYPQLNSAMQENRLSLKDYFDEQVWQLKKKKKKKRIIKIIQ